MFTGTSYLQDPSRHVLIETHYLKNFDETVVAPECFSIILLESGCLSADVQGTQCFFEGPTVICLDELKKLKVQSSTCRNTRVINFDPQFLNLNMTIATIRSFDYDALCQQHAFFELSPFLTQDMDKLSFKVGDDTFTKMVDAFNQITRNLQEQKDWYWPCRARSYFIDIITILERIFHNFYVEEPDDSLTNPTISTEFKNILAYINNHLDEKLTLDSLYQQFRINKNQIESLFREYFQITFYEYLKNRRFEEATYYLRFTELDGEQIAGRIGMSSSQNFCKFFRAISGKSPNVYRKEKVTQRKTDKVLAKMYHPSDVESCFAER